MGLSDVLDKVIDGYISLKGTSTKIEKTRKGYWMYVNGLLAGVFTREELQELLKQIIEVLNE